MNLINTHSYFQYSATNEDKLTFVSVDRYEVDVGSIPSSGNFLSVIFVKDSSYDSYERVTFSFLDATGNIGGLFEVLSVAGFIIVEFFSKNQFFYSLLSRLYQVDAPKISTLHLSLNLLIPL